jgi:hypothetical protein
MIWNSAAPVCVSAGARDHAARICHSPEPTTTKRKRPRTQGPTGYFLLVLSLGWRRGASQPHVLRQPYGSRVAQSHRVSCANLAGQLVVRNLHVLPRLRRSSATARFARAAHRRALGKRVHHCCWARTRLTPPLRGNRAQDSRLLICGKHPLSFSIRAEQGSARTRTSWPICRADRCSLTACRTHGFHNTCAARDAGDWRGG